MKGPIAGTPTSCGTVVGFRRANCGLLGLKTSPVTLTTDKNGVVVGATINIKAR